jgi:FemAB family protein
LINNNRQLPAYILHILSESPLETVLRENNHEKWEEVINNCAYTPVNYCSETIDFQVAYKKGHNIQVSDVSVIIYHDKKPCGIWPLSYEVENEHREIRSFGSLILPPLFISGISKKVKKKIVKLCLDIIEKISVKTDAKSINCEDIFLNIHEISDWHYELIRKGAVAKVKYELFVDIDLEVELIKGLFRKSYKALINSGLKKWKVEKLENADTKIWQEFKSLHLTVSGRTTRSDQTWDVHYNALVRGNAFLIYLLDTSSKMVGGGFFLTTKQEGLYGVAAYDRTLFDDPLGHVVQFIAIQEMKKRGLRWYKIGLRPFAADFPQPTEKEISIGEFKEGFATHVFPKYTLSFEIKEIISLP